MHLQCLRLAWTSSRSNRFAERQVDSELVFSLDRRLERLVAELRLGDLTAGKVVILVLVEEARTESCGSTSRAELEFLHAGDLDVFADAVRARKAIERVAALRRLRTAMIRRCGEVRRADT